MVHDNATVMRGNPNQLKLYLEDTLGSQRSDVQEIANIDRIQFRPGTYRKCLDQIERSLACSLTTVGEDLSDPISYQAYQTNCLTTAINRLYQSNKQTYALMIGNGTIDDARKDRNYPLFKAKLQEFDKHALDMSDETAEDTLNYKIVNTSNRQEDKETKKAHQYSPLSTEYQAPPNMQLQRRLHIIFCTG